MWYGDFRLWQVAHMNYVHHTGVSCHKLAHELYRQAELWAATLKFVMVISTLLI